MANLRQNIKLNLPQIVRPGFKNTNFNKFKKFAEVSDVVNGLAVGRENDQERILAYNIGIAIHDMNFAMHAYRLIADSNKKLLDIDLKAPSEKFWI